LANSRESIPLSLQDIDDLLLLWLGWYAIERDHALRTARSGYTYSLELSGDEYALRALLDPEHAHDQTMAYTQGRIVQHSPVEPLTHAAAAILLPDTVSQHLGLHGAELVITVKAGSLVAAGLAALVLRPAETFTLVLNVQLTGDRLRLRSLEHLRPGANFVSQSPFHAAYATPASHDRGNEASATSGQSTNKASTAEVMSALFDGLGVFNAARIEALEAERHNGRGALGFHFQCRNAREAEQLARLAAIVTPDRHLAYSDDLVLTDMDPQLDLPVLIAYLHVGQHTTLFR